VAQLGGGTIDLSTLLGKAVASSLSKILPGVTVTP
jgi:hypothetical protein